MLTLQVYELYYRRYQYTSTSCCVDVRDSLLLCHLCTFLSQSTRVEAELQSAECGGAFKAKAVLKCRLVHTLSIHTFKFLINSDSNFHMWTWTHIAFDWLLNMKVIDLRKERKTIFRRQSWLYH